MSTKRKASISALLVSGVIFIAGIILLFSSTGMGLSAGSRAISNNGGSMDTNQYEMVINNASAAYRAGGLVLSLLGGCGILLYGYVFIAEK